MAEDYEIVDGVLKGPKKYPGDLDLRGTPITDLGSLESVGGDLYLENTYVTGLGSLESVGGHLDLYGTSVTDLGSLESVGGDLDLWSTSITDLGSLKSVGGRLDLEGSAVSDLGSLEYVGVVYTDDSKHYSFQDLKVLVQEIEESSISALVERLPIEKDPFLRRVIERGITNA